MSASTDRSSRRTFLKGVAAAGAAVGAASALGFPRVATASNKSGKEPIIVGAGDHRYEVMHDWGQLPKTIAYGNTHGVCEDSQGRIYIKHTIHASSQEKNAMVVFDADGKYVGAWGAELGIGGGAHGLHLSKEGSQEYLYLCDQARGLVFKTDLAGKVVWQRGVPDANGLYANPGEYHPTNVAIHNDTLFIGDGYGKNWIHIYDTAGNYKKSFGGSGSDPGKLSCPHGLMIDTRGSTPVLAVADRGNNRIQYFSLGGEHLSFVKDELKLPCHFHQRGTDLLIPDLQARVTIFNKDNKLITHLCDGEKMDLRDKARDQFLPGKFICPHGAIWDHAGNIFVVEWVEVGRVTKLKRVS